MTPKEFQNLIRSRQRQIIDAIHRRLPVKIGRMATDHFQDNFRKGGFVNGGLQPWPVTRRQQQPGDSADSQYGPLLSARKNLFGSIRYIPGDASVTVGTDLHYAPVHNNGAVITSHPRVTTKMRKFAWRQFFAAGGKKAPKGSQAEVWKAIALTKKEKLTITSRIPKRQFIGPSEELRDKVQKMVEKEISNILKQ